ncbi:Inositol 2-dehydrogenase/D-chiro-inositol 3-dehydrogenase [Paenibacillus solanacearum]|uniref:Inositol 2-dehydrogenase/D-chiro-inositol 3-dehydrogenase n=1 Tax=Paenibacillus solanacearum TaxID=2048548 RepID=A0A916JRA2_9BACL|nr:Gfo/Idh/MocA family oxidoreductase [Paenibacillus solanacearum]CAG7596501.1 Inositol 2-dehydrogenase/D-chiro-inositol 3-dehydrogenase [Paenibacillus solanacearum]
MLNVGLVGIGYMGRMHLRSYIRLAQEGYPVRVTAICDKDVQKFQGVFAEEGVKLPGTDIDFSPYRLYSDMEEMLEKERLDAVDLTLPTYLHAPLTVAALDKGVHVLCEKPMAQNAEEARTMLEAANRSGAKLMIAQVLRFWPEYEYLKQTVDSGRYGRVISASFFRGGPPTKHTHDNWMLRSATSGGGLLDMHIHDIDIVYWLFGKPEAVSTLSVDVLDDSSFDAMSTNYLFADAKVVNTQIDRVLCGEIGFHMSYRVNFERGTLVYEKRQLSDYPRDGKAFVPELSQDSGYYREIQYFLEAVRTGVPVERALPEHTLDSLLLAEAQRRSALQRGAVVAIT